MTHAQVMKLLKLINACSQGTAWARRRKLTARQLWDQCEFPNFMWYVTKSVLGLSIANRAEVEANRATDDDDWTADDHWCDEFRKAMPFAKVHAAALKRLKAGSRIPA